MPNSYATELAEPTAERPILSPPSERRATGLLVGMLAWLCVLGLILFLTGCEDATTSATRT